MKIIPSCAFVIFLVAAGCGGGAVQFMGPDAAMDGSGGELSDGWAGDHAMPAELVGAEVVDQLETVSTVDLVDGVFEDQADWQPAPSPFGGPCTAHDQCESGLCLTHEALGLCTQGCDGSCPSGWTCLAAEWAGGDVSSACFPETAILCRPCQSKDDCAPGVTPFEAAEGDAFCMSYGIEGHYCAQGCQDDADCPEGFTCDSWFDTDGAPVEGCRRSAGICDCSPLSVALEATTKCKVGNESGACSGTRTCTEDGLSTCDGPTPAPESCNGLDDNCNGKVDEGTGGELCEMENAYGLCTGALVCVDGELLCDAAIPAPEECDGLDNDCNGVTDEGFPDSNDNGLVDCLESDEDEDGVFDYEDNCVSLSNPDQKDNDDDGLGDLCDDDDDNDGVLDDDDCAPFQGSISPDAKEVCNGIDDNCDEVVDEGFADSNDDDVADCMEDDSDDDAIFDYEDNCPDAKNPGQEDSDDDGVGDACDDDDDGDGWPDAVDCGPLNPLVFPDAIELCNGVDDDCNGLVDDGFADVNDNGVADCFEFEDSDGDGVWDEFDCAPDDPAVYPDAPELCNGIDDDCDEAIDEDLEPQVCGVGACTNTVPACVAGEIPPCEALDAATQEVCDGLDNDCDGDTDEELGETTCGDGLCQVTVANCEDGAPQPCVPLDIAGIEKCDGLDNDCDGDVDEALGVLNCGLGACAVEVPVCENGEFAICQPLDIAAPEICDEIDNDCDGSVDEGAACQECQTLTFGENQYLFCLAEQSWSAARGFCQGEEMDLAGVSSEAEDTWVYSTAWGLKETVGWWFGFHDQAVEGTFQWANGDPVDYENWKEGEPNNVAGAWGDGEDCGSVVGWGGVPGWNDLHCDYWALPFVCEDIDTDQDGTPDRLDPDNDGDSVADAVDNCPNHPNPEQVDSDGDGLGQPCDADDDGDGDADVTDCAPLDPTIFAGAAESCDNFDSDCDGDLNDEDALGCLTWYEDVDQDSWGIPGGKCLCQPVAPFTAEDMGDCNDASPLVNPDLAEVCGDDLDNDCDPSTHCFWVTVGGQNIGFEPVITNTNAVAFYGYAGSSSTTGYEKADTTRFIMHQGPNGALSLVFINDIVNDADGGDVDVKIKTGFGNAQVLLSDDADEAKFNKNGEFDAKWKWATCCTDGAVLGPIDGSNGLEIPVEVKLQAGVKGAEMVSGGGQSAIPLGTGTFTFTIHKQAD